MVYRSSSVLLGDESMNEAGVGIAAMFALMSFCFGAIAFATTRGVDIFPGAAGLCIICLIGGITIFVISKGEQ